MTGKKAIWRAFGWLAASVATVCGADDPVLEGFIRQALGGNPGIQAIAHRVDAARAVQRQARSAFLPRMSATASYARTDNPPQAFMMALNQGRLDMSDPDFNLNSPDDTENIRFSVGVRHRLYDGARGASAAAAGMGRRIAAAGELAARNTLAHEVTRAYYQVLEAQAFVEVQEAALGSLEESLRAATERFESGSVFKTDVLNLDVQTAQARENLIRARNGVQLAIAALNTAIGAPAAPDTGLAIPATEPDPPRPTEALSTEARPEYELGVMQAESARLLLKAARRSRGPVLNAFGSVDWDSEDLSDTQQSYMAGAALEWEWFAGFEQSAKVDEATALLHAAAAEIERVRQDLALDLKQAQLSVQESWARMQITLQAIGGAGEALRITRAQYKEGAAEISVLLVAELGLTETRMRHIAARYDYQIARSNLERAAGLLAERYGKQNIE